MNVGSIVHEIIQQVMKRNLTTLKEIKKVADEYLKSQDIIHLLYSCKMSLNDLYKEVEPFLTRIHDFMRQYIVGDLKADLPATPQAPKPYHGRISEIQDIEENVWCPRLGLKGKIDVTVKVNPSNKFFDSFQKLMPLEIKTGKASFSLEHKGQLILYQLMMQDLGQQIDSGLLLYIREGVMSEITAAPVEKLGLIQLRNRLAHYLSLDLTNKDREVNLPEPINHHSACERCEHKTICCTFLQPEKLKLPAGHSLLKVQKKVTDHLTEAHVNYFMHWCHLITLEHNEAQKAVKLRHIWTKQPEARAAKGTALINLKIVDLVQPLGDEYVHHFGDPSVDFTSTNFDVGEYLIVSTDTRCSVAAGRVTKIESNYIALTLSRDLSHQYASCRFHLDRYESQSQSIFNFSNIAWLMEKDDKLRSIIIDRSQARFVDQLPRSTTEQGEKILLQMNSVQRKAVLKAMTCENYMLIKGLPGTGKTQTLIRLIQLLMIMKKSVLITSHTNSAVDNILMRLMERGIKFMRLGSATRVHQSLRDYREATLVADCESVEELEAVYKSHQIVAVTCLGSSHSLLSQRRFDYCLVDEATQIFQPTVIRPLLSADKFVLVGDPEQLSPLVRSSEGFKCGADESLFARLDSPESTMVLGLQYRMNRVITKLANNLTYNGQLKCGNEAVEKASMKVMNLELMQEKLRSDKWLSKVLSTHIDQSCTLINTGDVYQTATQFAESVKDDSKKEFADKSKLYVNFCEIAIVLYIVDLLIECKVPGESIGVIAPYRGQVDALKKVLAHHSTVEVNTVDQYQGRDKNVIIYSCTQSKVNAEAAKSSSEVEILDDRRRLTVAITRAKHKLIMVGDVACLNNFAPFNDLFKHMNSLSKQRVEDNKLDFSWEKLLNNLREKTSFC